ncbi:tetratricopeptide repeat protein, partial [Streptomyces sp. NPDC058964]|uniref:tetratricopeptide repeat protein n=1 Tax=Streptomyces sp. NPDC058964 TaxID=3346681 RepID=UPI0036865C8F
DLRTGRDRFERAYRIAESVGEERSMAVAALGFGGLWVHEHRTVAGSVLLESQIRRALELLDPQSSLALRLRIRLAGEGDYRNSDNTAVLALLEQARAGQNPMARAEALSLAHHCLIGPEHGALRRELAAELVAESFRTSRRSDLLMGLLWQTVDMFLDGDPHAERCLAELRGLLAEQDHLAVGFVVSAMEVMLAVRAGRLDEAEALARACTERGIAAGDVNATVWQAAQLVTIRWYQGRVVELVPLLSEVVNSPTLSAVDDHALAALAVAAVTAGDRRKAVSALATLCGRDLGDLPRSSSWMVTMHGVAEAAYLLDDPAMAARVYELLSPYGHLPVVGSLAVACFGSAHHALGVAALTMGDVDRAVTHLREAARQNLALAHWPAVTASWDRLAVALVRAGRPAEADAVRREMAVAAEEAAAPPPETDGHGSADPRGGDGQGQPAAFCTRLGRKWRVGFGSRSVLVEHSVGMLHLVVLIANPRQEIRAVDLVAGLTALNGDAGYTALSGQPVLDRVATQEYRNRLARLRTELDAFKAADDQERAAVAQVEHDWLMGQLAGATGLSGRARRFPEGEERSRVAVSKAVRRALDRIAAADPVIGEHLRHAVHTGVRCSYWPA